MGLIEMRTLKSSIFSERVKWQVSGYRLQRTQSIRSTFLCQSTAIWNCKNITCTTLYSNTVWNNVSSRYFYTLSVQIERVKNASYHKPLIGLFKVLVLRLILILSYRLQRHLSDLSNKGESWMGQDLFSCTERAALRSFLTCESLYILVRRNEGMFILYILFEI